MYYVVTQGRARQLDRLNLRDRSTYGLDWMVFEAGTARDAIRQWGLFRAGTHPRQGALELESVRYRLQAPGYAPVWEAESDAIAAQAAARLDLVEARRRELALEQEALNETRETLLRASRLGGAPRRSSRARRRTRKAAPTATRRRKAA